MTGLIRLNIVGLMLLSATSLCLGQHNSTPRASGGAEEISLPRREHPFLFAGGEEIARAKARIEKYSWAKRQFDLIMELADEMLTGPLDIPDEGGQWSGHYACKKCGGGLEHENGKHTCKLCGEVYTGWPYDQVVCTWRHSRNFLGMRALGLAYAFTGREAYAERAREILLGYARKYSTYPLHDVRGQKGRGARVYAQTLDEAAKIIPAVWGYDLIYNSPCLSAEDRRTIEQKFFREVAKTIRGNNRRRQNWQAWQNAATIAIGLCLQDKDIAGYGIDGLRFQLQESVGKDGFWYEGTAAYHYYALSAIQCGAEAARRANIDLYKNQPNLKAMYEAPLLYAFGDMTFPAVGDSDVFPIVKVHENYEIAYARFGNPEFSAVVLQGTRDSLTALLWGAEKLPPATKLTLESRNFAALGAVVLRQGSGADQLYVHLDYNTPDKGHGHPDKLSIILFGLGRQLAPDPGRLSYSVPMHKSWYNQTFAHNTVCVDQQSHRPATGNLTMFQSQGGFVVAQAECDSAYPGVKMKRTVAINKRYLIDIFSVTSDAEHTYDWVYHNFGQIVPALPVAPREEKLGEKAGYQHMKDIAQAKTAGTWSADFKQDGANVRLTMLAAAGTELYFGMGLADNPPRSCPMVVVRRKGKTARFISIIEPYKEAPAVTGVKMIPVSGGGGAITLEITCGGQRELFILAGRATERIN